MRLGIQFPVSAACILNLLPDPLNQVHPSCKIPSEQLAQHTIGFCSTCSHTRTHTLSPLLPLPHLGINTSSNTNKVWSINASTTQNEHSACKAPDLCLLMGVLELMTAGTIR